MAAIRTVAVLAMVVLILEAAITSEATSSTTVDTSAPTSPIQDQGDDIPAIYANKTGDDSFGGNTTYDAIAGAEARSFCVSTLCATKCYLIYGNKSWKCDPKRGCLCPLAAHTTTRGS